MTLPTKYRVQLLSSTGQPLATHELHLPHPMPNMEPLNTTFPAPPAGTTVRFAVTPFYAGGSGSTRVSDAVTVPFLPPGYEDVVVYQRPQQPPLPLPQPQPPPGARGAAPQAGRHPFKAATPPYLALASSYAVPQSKLTVKGAGSLTPGG